MTKTLPLWALSAAFCGRIVPSQAFLPTTTSSPGSVSLENTLGSFIRLQQSSSAASFGASSSSIEFSSSKRTAATSQTSPGNAMKPSQTPKQPTLSDQEKEDDSLLLDLQSQITAGDKDALSSLRQLASFRTLEGAQQAEQLLNWLETQTTTTTTGQPLTRKHYTVVLDAYGSAGDVVRAQAIFQRMKEAAQVDCTPSHVTVNVLLHAYARQNDATAAQALFNEQTHWRTEDLNVVLGILAKQGKVPQIQKLLKKCTSASSTTKSDPLNWQSYHYLLEAYSKYTPSTISAKQLETTVEELTNMTMDLPLQSASSPEETYTLIFQAMAAQVEHFHQSAKSSHKNNIHTLQSTMEQGQRLWQHLLEQQRNQQQQSATTSIFPTLLACLNFLASGQTESSARQAEQLWQQYKSDPKMTPETTVAYNTLLKAWKGNMMQSERLMKELREYGNVSPNALSYTTYLSTMAQAIARNPKPGQRKQMALQAEQVLLDIQQQEDSSNAQQVNIWTYNSVLHCWSAAGLLPRAEQLLMDLEQRGKVSISSYTTV